LVLVFRQSFENRSMGKINALKTLFIIHSTKLLLRRVSVANFRVAHYVISIKVCNLIMHPSLTNQKRDIL